MKHLIVASIFSLLITTIAMAQIQFADASIRIFDSKGNPSTIDQIVKVIGDNEAVFLGEQHDDAVGHAVQMEIFQRVVDRYAGDHKVALSLEMFERDVQVVVDEYLTNLITEAQFMASARPWGNYKTDYRPLVELAKVKKLPVIAANAPHHRPVSSSTRQFRRPRAQRSPREDRDALSACLL